MARRTNGCGKGFTDRQVGHLLDLVEEMLPLGLSQWENVGYAYNRSLPSDWPARDVESLRRKFFRLKNARKPTGTVQQKGIPTVRQRSSKQNEIYRQIEASVFVVEMDDAPSAIDLPHTVTSSAVPTCAQQHPPAHTYEPLVAAPFGSSALNDHGVVEAEDSMITATTTIANGTTPPISISSPCTTVDTIATSSATAFGEVGQRGGHDSGSSESETVGAPLRASSRTGKRPSELAKMSIQLKRHRCESAVALSESARKRAKFDRLLDDMSQPDTELQRMLAWVEERAHQRELHYQEEQDARDECKRRDRAEQEHRENERAEREA